MEHKSNTCGSQESDGPRPPTLLADAMLGRLARWLRLIGYDTVYAQGWPDHQVAARARAEGRIVLTRDRELARRRGIRCLLIEGHMLEAQLTELWTTIPLPSGPMPPRCPRCNAALEVLPPAAAQDRVPPYVFRTQTTYRRCPECDRVYWQGSHWRHVQQIIERVRARLGA
ncbi:MAG: Mut7-C RNAse domain-containing protein [Anaerolineae bacterium]|nr:Mut7-C RNAse domain-containing protein [Anaerolineae bacterium]